jgi:hypothetical protein
LFTLAPISSQPLLLRLMLDFLAERFGGEVAPWDR